MHEKKRNPIVAALFSILDPGLGFIYNGKLRKGVAVSVSYILFAAILFPLGLLQSISGILILILLLLIPGFRLACLVLSIFDSKRTGSVQLTQVNRWYVYVAYAAGCTLLLYLVMSFSSTRSFSIPTVGMEPTIESGEYFVADMGFYKNHPITPGDVVVFRYPRDPNQLFIKRCVALGGQKLEIRDAVVYVDSQRFMPSLVVKRSDQAIKPVGMEGRGIVPEGAGNEDQYGPIRIPEDQVFTLGDHRDNSLDSRYFGGIEKADVVGKALYVYWSRDFGRIGTRIQ